MTSLFLAHFLGSVFPQSNKYLYVFFWSFNEYDTITVQRMVYSLQEKLNIWYLLENFSFPLVSVVERNTVNIGLWSRPNNYWVYGISSNEDRNECSNKKNSPFLSKSFSAAAKTRNEAENMNCSKLLALATILAKTRKGRS